MPDYFTLAEFRALPDMASDSKYPDARVEAAAAHIVEIIEREVDTSFVARTVTDEIHDGGGYELILTKPYVLSVTSAEESGTAVTDTLSVTKSGLVRRYAAGSYVPKVWLSGNRNLSVTYEAGYSSTPPADIKEAALWGTRSYLLEHSSGSSVMDRRSTVTSDQGTTSFVLAGPDRPTGYPEVDAVILGWKKRLGTSLVA